MSVQPSTIFRARSPKRQLEENYNHDGDTSSAARALKKNRLHSSDSCSNTFFPLPTQGMGGFLHRVPDNSEGQQELGRWLLPINPDKPQRLAQGEFEGGNSILHTQKGLDDITIQCPLIKLDLETSYHNNGEPGPMDLDCPDTIPESAAAELSLDFQALETSSSVTTSTGLMSPISNTQICFGMLREPTLTYSTTSKVKISTERFSGIISVQLEVAGPMIVILDKRRQYLGVLDPHSSKGIQRLQSEFPAINLEAFIPSETDHTLDSMTENTFPVFIIVYGIESTSIEVGKLLGQCRLYLQEPKHYKKSLRYKNPQYLYMPGEDEAEQMQFEVSISTGTTNTPASGAELVTLQNTSPNFVASIVDQLDEIDLLPMTAPPQLRTSLLPHQKEALYYMLRKERYQLSEGYFTQKWLSLWVPAPQQDKSREILYQNLITNEIMSSPRLCHGGIVADEMGLGKTLTALALIASTREEAVIFGERASAETQPSHAKTTLIVFPAVLRHEWESQIRTHFEPQALHVYSFHGPNKHTNVRDLATFDIVLISYDTLRNEIVLDSNRQFSQQTFSRVNWFRIILDEAHKIGSKSTKKMNAICTLQSQRRWCLTGTPIQNKIEDLGILYQFLRVAPFDDPRVFSRHIAKPLDVRKPEGQNAREAREKLRLLLNATVLRRTKKKVHLNLAPRTDQICYGCFTPSERHFYETCKEVSIKLLKLGLPNATSLGIILRLRQICNHKALLPKDFSHRLELYMNWKGHPAQAQEWTDTVTGGDLAAPELDIPESDTLQEPSDEHELLNPRNTSTKVKLLIERLLQTEFESKLAEHPIKSVVFSCWTTMLDVIELALKAEGIQYLRLDGKTSSNQRGAIIDAFQNGSDASVFLISINSGCTGLTLTAASRVHIMEPQWNPMVECQALDRVHRIGQDQDVVTIRYVMKDTIEESIHSYQRRKLDLINYTLEDKAISKDALLAYLTGHHDLFDS